jgi:hypothetical protein
VDLDGVSEAPRFGAAQQLETVLFNELLDEVRVQR